MASLKGAPTFDMSLHYLIFASIAVSAGRYTMRHLQAVGDAHSRSNVGRLQERIHGMVLQIR